MQIDYMEGLPFSSYICDTSDPVRKMKAPASPRLAITIRILLKALVHLLFDLIKVCEDTVKVNLGLP